MHRIHVTAASVLIGAPGETWLNRYVEIRGGPGAPFDSLAFEGVNSPDDLRRFSVDDMTITPVPEPFGAAGDVRGHIRNAGAAASALTSVAVMAGARCSHLD